MSMARSTSESYLTILTPLQAHLLLALSAQENLLISLTDAESLPTVLAGIDAFCSDKNISRSSRIVSHQRGQVANLYGDSLLSHFFIPSVDADTQEGRTETAEKLDHYAHGFGDLPQVFVLPYVDELPRSTQATLKDILRDRHFVFEKEDCKLPTEFVCIAVTVGHEGFERAEISRHLVSNSKTFQSCRRVDQAY